MLCVHKHQNLYAIQVQLNKDRINNWIYSNKIQAMKEEIIEHSQGKKMALKNGPQHGDKNF